MIWLLWRKQINIQQRYRCHTVIYYLDDRTTRLATAFDIDTNEICKIRKIYSFIILMVMSIRCYSQLDELRSMMACGMHARWVMGDGYYSIRYLCLPPNLPVRAKKPATCNSSRHTTWNQFHPPSHLPLFHAIDTTTHFHTPRCILSLMRFMIGNQEVRSSSVAIALVEYCARRGGWHNSICDDETTISIHHMPTRRIHSVYECEAQSLCFGSKVRGCQKTYVLISKQITTIDACHGHITNGWWVGDIYIARV